MSSRLLTIVPPVDRHKLRLESEGIRIAIGQFDILLCPMNSFHVICIQNIYAISDRLRLDRNLLSLSTFPLVQSKYVERAALRGRLFERNRAAAASYSKRPNKTQLN